MYSVQGKICGPWERVSGWIGHFFPYSKTNYGEFDRNPLLTGGESPSVESFPNGLRQVQLKSVNGTVLKLLGGFLGIAQDSQSMSLQPQTGWAVQRLNPFEELLDEFCRLDTVNVQDQSAVDLGDLDFANDQKLKSVYSQFRNIQIKGNDGQLTCEFLPLECIEKYTQTFDGRTRTVSRFANLQNDQWIGVLHLTTVRTVREFLLSKNPIPVVYFVGDSSVDSDGLYAQLISTDLEVVLNQVLRAARNSTSPKFEFYAKVDPFDFDSIERELMGD